MKSQSLIKASKNPDFSFEALKMMDDHVEQSELLKVPLPKSNLSDKRLSEISRLQSATLVNNYF